MADFLLELFSEEIPARMQPAAAKQLGERFAALLAEAGLTAEHVETHATPRRLALLATGLPDASAATSEERRGPRADAPAQAIEGFLKSTGLKREQLEERDTGKGVFLFANLKSEERPTADILAEKLPALIAGFQWPKSQRWGPASVSTASPRWVRPLRGIIALLDGEVVPFEALGLKSGRETFGHRFMGPKERIAIESPRAYAGQLLAAKVVLSAEERRRTIHEGAETAAAEAGLRLRPDEGLEAENAGLTEWPVPMLGRFDPAYLEVPPEIIQLTMRTNQKYFALEDAEGRLAHGFVCVANLEGRDGGKTVIAGNERVLSARLADARFFWEQDKRKLLEEHASKLDRILFHESLGTLSQKITRVAELSEWIIEKQARYPESWSDYLAGETASLAKADIVSLSVGEFPELQGVIGGYLAELEGRDAEVVSAIRQHYVGLPNKELAAIIALADRLDTVFLLFFIGELPSGSRDPFALRRATLSIIQIMLYYDIRIDLAEVCRIIANLFLNDPPPGKLIVLIEGIEEQVRDSGIINIRNFYGPIDKWTDESFVMINGGVEGRLDADSAIGILRSGLNIDSLSAVTNKLRRFFSDRLKVQQREAGVRHDLIDAVFAGGREDDIVRLLARVRALQAFVETDDGKNLLAGYKRATNILKAEEKKDETRYALDPSIPLSKYVGETEKNLARLFTAEDGTDAMLLFDEADELLAREDFQGAMKLLATLRAPVDAFFEGVTVNDPDPDTRARRLGLLAAVRDAMHKVADFSKIEG